MDKDKIAIEALSTINETTCIVFPEYGTAELSIDGDILSIDMYGEMDLPGIPTVNIAKYKLERVC